MFHRFDILNTLNSFLFHYVTQVVLHVLLSFSEDFVESHFINLVQKIDFTTFRHIRVWGCS